jgi:hypothetical protein
MVREKQYAVLVNFPPDLEERIRAWAKHQGNSVNSAVVSAVREAVLAYEGEDTTRTRVQRMDTMLTELNDKFDLLQAMGWAQLNALELTVRVSDADWDRVERLLERRL